MSLDITNIAMLNAVVALVLIILAGNRIPENKKAYMIPIIIGFFLLLFAIILLLQSMLKLMLSGSITVL